MGPGIRDREDKVTERRAPVQGDGKPWSRPPGTISWEEHLEAWEVYDRRFHGQTAARIAERGGFGFAELVGLLGRKPTTWRPR